jgi:hypothetical protein
MGVGDLMDMVGFDDVMNEFSQALSKVESGATWVVGTATYYAIHVEFGTASQKAQPYIRPAAEKVLARLHEIEKEAKDMDDLIKRIALAIEREAKKLCPVLTGNLKASIEAERIG